MTTARGIITSALRKNGVLVKSETPSADEVTDGLASLNAMLSSWSNDSGSIYARVWENFSLVSGTASYTIGTSQTFNTSRPIIIAEAHIRQGNTDYPLSIIPDEAYNGIWDKATQSIPQVLNYDNGYPSGTIRLWPVPISSLTLYLLSEKELSQFTLDQAVSLPPGWERALIYNLSIELAPEYGVEPSAATVEIAKLSKASIQKTILKNRSMDAQPSINRTYNIYGGW